MSLRALFDDLSPPPLETGGSLHVNTVRVPGKPEHRLGKDADGSPLLLIQVAIEKGARPADIRLENIAVLHDVACRVWSNDSPATDRKFTVVRCNAVTEDVRQYFLHVAEPLLAMLGPTPTADGLSQLVDHLVEVFRALSQPPRGSVQGLWAELFVITEARDPVLVTDSWHALPEDTFDFASGAQRVEIKSCNRAERRHSFSLEQLAIGVASTGMVISVITQRAGGGISVADLANRARSKVAGHPELLLKIDKTVALTLGDSSTLALDERFNEVHARESVAFFDLKNIPRPTGIPDQISNVRFEADISSIPQIALASLEHSTSLIQAIIPKQNSSRS